MQVLWDVTLDIKAGETVVLLGSNGAGKTTLIKVLMGLHKSIGGIVTLENVHIENLLTHERARRGLIYMSDLACIPDLTVEDNLLLSLRKLPKRQRRIQLDRLYGDFKELFGRRTALANMLSGGQRKLLGAARAIAANPKVLLMDEPSAGLSPAAVERLIQILMDHRVSGNSKYALLLAEQNVAFLKLADRVSVLEGGRNIFNGIVSDLRKSDAMERAYFG